MASQAFSHVAWLGADTQNNDPHAGNGNNNDKCIYFDAMKNNNARTTIRSATVTGTCRNDVHAYDVLKVTQSARPEFVDIDRDSYTFTNNGGTVNVTGLSNATGINFTISPSTHFYCERTFSITLNEGTGTTVTNIPVAIAISGDPGAAAAYTFTLQVTAPANASASSIQATLTAETIVAAASDTAILLQRASSAYFYFKDGKGEDIDSINLPWNETDYDHHDGTGSSTTPSNSQVYVQSNDDWTLDAEPES